MEYDTYDPTTSYPPVNFLKTFSGGASFPLLEFILNPTRTPILMQDAVLVSLDLESRHIQSLDKMQITQIGAVTFDPRVLVDVDTSNPQSLVNAVQSRVFNIYPKRASPRAWTPKSLWATPEEIGHDEICHRLSEIFNPTSDSLTIDQGPRDVVLIGHAVYTDCSLLKTITGFDIRRVATIKAILDTGRMWRDAYDFGQATRSYFTLRRVLQCLGVHYDQFHHAGNDAMFTMKALLLMFCNWKLQKGKYLWNIVENATIDAKSTSTTENLLWDNQLELLAAIARQSWPVAKKPTPYVSVAQIKPVTAEQDLLLSAEDLDLGYIFG